MKSRIVSVLTALLALLAPAVLQGQVRDDTRWFSPPDSVDDDCPNLM